MPDQGITEIECDVLFDGTRLTEGARVTVEGERITAVRPLNGDGPPAGATAAGNGQALHTRFLMPGLIDAHVHVVGYIEGVPSGAPFEPMKQFLRLCSLNGVTSVRDTGNSLETLAYVQEWGGKYLGPRVFGSGPLLDIPPLAWAASRIVRDEAAARREVGRLHDHDVDLIKAYRNVTPDVLAAIVEASTAVGLPVAIDCSVTPPRTAISLGVTSFEHLSNILDDGLLPDSIERLEGSDGRARMWSHADVHGSSARELADLLVEMGTYLVPTILVSRRWCFLDEMVGDPYLDYMALVMPYHRYFKNLRNPVGSLIGRRYMNRYMPIAHLSKSQRAEADHGFERMGELLVAFHEAGVKIAAGTDSANPSLAPGFSLHQELIEMVRCGMPAISALAAATSVNAELLGRQDLGVVQVGALADLVLVDGNPADRIEDLQRVEGVVKGGQLVDREELATKLKKDISEADR